MMTDDKPPYRQWVFTGPQPDENGAYDPGTPYTLTVETEADTIGGLLLKALTTDGVHHKQWYLFKIGQMLGLEAALRKAGVDDMGIAP